MKPPKDNIEALMQIRDIEKLTCMGGFIGETSKQKIAEVFRYRFKCPLELLLKALEFKESVDVRELLTRTEKMYTNASSENSWFRSNAKYSSSLLEKREFTRWFIDTSLRLCAKAMTEDNFLDLVEFFSEDNDYQELAYIIRDMTWIEKKVLSYRYNEEGEIDMDAKSIAKLPEFNCKKEYIEGIIRYFNVKIKTMNKADKAGFFKIVHLGACVEETYMNNEEYDPMIDAYEIDESSIIEILSEEELIELSEYMKE